MPEGRRIFPDLTVLNNLRMGAFIRKDSEMVQKEIDEWVERISFLKARRLKKAKN